MLLLNQNYVALRDAIAVLQIDLVLPVSRDDQFMLSEYYSHSRDNLSIDVVRLFQDAGIKLIAPRQNITARPVLASSSAPMSRSGTRETAAFRWEDQRDFDEEDSDLDLEIERRWASPATKSDRKKQDPHALFEPSTLPQTSGLPRHEIESRVSAASIPREDVNILETATRKSSKISDTAEVFAPRDVLLEKSSANVIA